MKIRLLLILSVLAVGIITAQSQYPLVTIHDIQNINGVDTLGFVQSTLTDDTVRVRGIVMVKPLVDADTNRMPTMYYGARWGTYIQDSSDSWGGLNVLQNDSTAPYQGTFFDIADTGDYVEMTGVVTNYGQTNELMLLINPVTEINYLSHLPKRPDPKEMSLTDFMNNGTVNKGAMKYTGMYVEFHNLISSDRNTSSGGFNLNDGNGNSMIVYPQSRYFRLDANKMPGSTYQPPQDGTPINTIRGIITVYNDGFELLPIYPNDIYITLTPPTISTIKRDQVQVKTNTPVTVSAKIVGGSGNVTTAELHYKVGSQDRVAITMTKSTNDTTIYSAVIPGINKDSTFVDYFITGKDNLDLTGYSPSDTLKGNYFYQVLNEPLTIHDAQFSPFGSGYSSYNGYSITLSGIVTADTSDIPGFGSSTPLRIYMQDKTGPWNGILIGTRGNIGTDALKFKRGDNVTLTGVILENYSVTSIDSLSSIKINSSNNPLPDAVALHTGDIDKKTGSDTTVEKWESVLVKYNDMTVTNTNADGAPGANTNNHGEIFVNDGTGDARVELQDGNHNYHNLWDSTLVKDPLNIEVTDSSKFSEMTGILYYSFSYYKLVPRKNNDFSGYTPVAVKNEYSNIPLQYMLEQNYPNPFNPSTTISYSIPKEGMVTLKIYNILGQEVQTIVNQNMRPGSYKVNFNADRLSSGVYFYSLRVGEFNQVKKMLLLK